MEGFVAEPEIPPSDELEREIAQLRRALDHRGSTAQATGILAGQLGIGTDIAWGVLWRLSNITNVKVREVARVVVERHDGVRRPEDDDIARKIGGALQLSLTRALDAGERGEDDRGTGDATGARVSPAGESCVMTGPPPRLQH